MSLSTVLKCTKTKHCDLTGMMGPGMNGMTGGPAPGNFMQQVNAVSKNTQFPYF